MVCVCQWLAGFTGYPDVTCVRISSLSGLNLGEVIFNAYFFTI